MFANGLGDWSSITGRVIPKKMVLDASLLYTQCYKAVINGKVEQSRESSGALLYNSVLLKMKKDPMGHPRLRSPTLLTFTFMHIYVHTYIHLYVYEHKFIHTYICNRWTTVFESVPKAPFSIATKSRCRRGCNSFP